MIVNLDLKEQYLFIKNKKIINEKIITKLINYINVFRSLIFKYFYFILIITHVYYKIQ
jgi:hypothetical protein